MFLLNLESCDKKQKHQQIPLSVVSLVRQRESAWVEYLENARHSALRAQTTIEIGNIFFLLLTFVVRVSEPDPAILGHPMALAILSPIG